MAILLAYLGNFLKGLVSERGSESEEASFL
jgi:hypothetical protein